MRGRATGGRGASRTARAGLRTVYAAAVSRRGVESLRQAAARLVTARMQGLDRDRALRARGRLQAFAVRLEEMVAHGVKASDLGWSGELGTAVEGVLPTRVPGGEGHRRRAGCGGGLPAARGVAGG